MASFHNPALSTTITDMDSQLHIILTSIDSSEQAKTLAKALIETQWAACVQISSSGTSFYRWQGKIEQSDEVFISIKTLPRHSARIIAWLEEHHPYDTPEIICLDGTASKPYGEWMLASVK